MPLAVIIAGILIAGAVIFSGDGRIGDTNKQEFGNNNSPTAENVREVGENDHIKGDINVPVSIIEYSDFECPFCARLHPTLSQIVEDFDGEVNWIYRHFPLTSIHADARPAAIASECVANLAGNNAFWDFADELFSGGKLGNNVYVSLAADLGIKESDFSTCLSSNKFEKRVDDDTQNAVDSGGRGTPYIIVVNEDGQVFPFSGALPYENIKTIVEAAIGGHE